MEQQQVETSEENVEVEVKNKPTFAIKEVKMLENKTSAWVVYVEGQPEPSIAIGGTRLKNMYHGIKSLMEASIEDGIVLPWEEQTTLDEFMILMDEFFGKDFGDKFLAPVSKDKDEF